MYQTKTKPENQAARDYILSLRPERRRADGLKLLEMFEEETPWPPVLWTGNMVGFGQYHYKYDSGHEGDAFRVGFAPRKGKISLYLMQKEDDRANALSRLGKHSTGVGCIYVNKLADIDETVLRKMIRQAVDTMQKLYPE
ncbi:MAG: DUF1801 domain-containing protein [Clostridiales bacterium]|nr:DUF1801 domain-containing protein [Clostridiales bacterium]